MRQIKRILNVRRSVLNSLRKRIDKMFVAYMKRSEYTAHGHRGLLEKEAVTQPIVHLKAARNVVCRIAFLDNDRPREKNALTVRRWDIMLECVVLKRENQSSNRKSNTLMSRVKSIMHLR